MIIAPVVAIAHGLVRGVPLDSGGVAFRNIPYAGTASQAGTADAASRATMVFNLPSAVVSDPRPGERELWEDARR